MNRFDRNTVTMLLGFAAICVACFFLNKHGIGAAQDRPATPRATVSKEALDDAKRHLAGSFYLLEPRGGACLLATPQWDRNTGYRNFTFTEVICTAEVRRHIVNH